MYSNYLKVGLRSAIKHKAFSFINVFGLSAGMAVTILIGLWIWDEVSANRYHGNYDRIGVVTQHLSYNGVVGTQEGLPFPVSYELREKFGADFKYVVAASGTMKKVLSNADKRFSRLGRYMDDGAPDMLSLRMKSGTSNGLKDLSAVMLSESLSVALFGTTDATGKLIRIDNQDLTVTGVYEDLPPNSAFHELDWLANWKLYVANEKLESLVKYWDWNGWWTYVQLNDNVDFEAVSKKIAGLNPDKLYKPVFFINPMSMWRLYSRYDNGVRVGGQIEFVKLFGVTGGFVLLLACINFMNLSTARSEKRAKEVGIRKSIGSQRSQLIFQFFFESFIMTLTAFIIAIGLVQVILPFFNEIAAKQVRMPWTNKYFWLSGIAFTVLTGLIAGSYPAFYLSSFNPLKALKGTFKVGAMAVIPRRLLVVIQFSVSIILMVGTIGIFRQIQYAKDRPTGFNKDNLVMIEMTNNKIHEQTDIVRNELKALGAITEMAESNAPATDYWSTSGDISWEGKDPALASDFPNTRISQEYGKTVGWEFIDGRDFSAEYASDSSAFIITKSAAAFMSLKNPVGSILMWANKPYRVIGVINDPIFSPYGQLRPAVYHLSPAGGYVILKLNPDADPQKAMAIIESIFVKYNPEVPFDYQWADEEYNEKFSNEVHVGNLSTFFAALAILISCLGIFGLASFVAERRAKEIGVRKVLGASTVSLWQMLSKEFVILVLLSFIIAVPVSYHFLDNWLQQFDYRTNIAWWIFLATGIGTLIITLITVSYQAISAARTNPVKSLRSE